ncbi:MAG: lipid II flippase MurJ, partial [Solirubrobacteraceae bacterium]
MTTDSTNAGAQTTAPPPPRPRRRLALNTAIFAVATALSRIAGLGREVVQAGYFNTSAPGSAFTIASQVPNLFSNLFSQAALGAAFVPIFTELLQAGKKREAFRLASSLFWLILTALGALTLLYMVLAGVVTPLFTGTLSASDTALTAGLSRVLFPVVLMLSLTGLLVGILQSYDEFSIPALAPALWNIVIVVLMVILHGHFHGPNAVYSYAIAWLVATVVQFLLIAWALRTIDFRLAFAFDWRDPRIREVLILFLPVTLSIGIINLDIFINAG